MVTVFFLSNAIVAGSYGLLALFFAKRVRLPRHSLKAGWRTVVALIFASVFFIGCAHTHLELAHQAYAGLLDEHWFHWHVVLSHALQSIGGVGFFIFASCWVQLNIFDKKAYQENLTVIEREIAEGENGNMDRPS